MTKRSKGQKEDKGWQSYFEVGKIGIVVPNRCDQVLHEIGFHNVRLFLLYH